MTPEQLKHIAFLHQETTEQWTRRQYARWGMPEPSEAEMAAIIKDGKIDERDAHQ